MTLPPFLSSALERCRLVMTASTPSPSISRHTTAVCASAAPSVHSNPPSPAFRDGNLYWVKLPQTEPEFSFVRAACLQKRIRQKLGNGALDLVSQSRRRRASYHRGQSGFPPPHHPLVPHKRQDGARSLVCLPHPTKAARSDSPIVRCGPIAVNLRLQATI